MLIDVSEHQDCGEQNRQPVNKINVKKVLLILLGLVVLCSFLWGLSYYQGGSYLVGQNCFAVTGAPSDRLISSYKKVDHLTIDEDGMAVLIAPCKKGMDVRISNFVKDANGVPNEHEFLYENKSMNTNEAVLLKIRKDNPELVNLLGRKVQKTFIIPVDSIKLEKGKTVYFQFDK